MILTRMEFGVDAVLSRSILMDCRSLVLFVRSTASENTVVFDERELKT